MKFSSEFSFIYKIKKMHIFVNEIPLNNILY